MSRLDRYVLKEVLPMFLGGTAIALLLLTALKFYQGADDLSRSRMPIEAILRDIAYRMPSVLVMTLPVATALAASLATNRLARDNEVTVLRSCGVPLLRLCRPLFVFALLVTAGNLAVAEYLVPFAWRASQSLPGAPAQAMEGGNTLRSGPNLIRYDSAQKLTDARRRLAHVLIARSSPTLWIVTAPFASYEAGRFTLEDAIERRYDGAGALLSEQRRPTLTLNLPIDFNRAPFNLSGDALASLTFPELTRAAAEARRRGEARKANELEVNRWFKLSLPAMCLSLGLLAPPLALRFSRAGGFTGVLLSVLTVFVGWNTLLLMKYVALGGLLPPVVAAWSTNIAFALAGMLALWSAE